MLYPSLLGGAWASLDAPVRRLHLRASQGTAGAGVFAVERGTSAGARLCGWWMRLPAGGERVPVELAVRATPRGDRWIRSFAGCVLETLQYARGEGVLAERWGPIECRFRLEAQDGALAYRQIGAWLRVGPLALRLPHALAPSVTGVARGAGAERVRVDVAIGVPLFGPLIAYRGELAVAGSEEAAA
jgi:hypothetical protein